MSNGNILGGKNANSLYVPMSEDEQEILSRLIAADDLEVVVVGWSVLTSPKVRLGDKILSIQMTLIFNAPPLPVKVWFFDLELRTRSGLILHAERQPTIYGNQPISVCAGTTLDMIWDISIDRIPPAVVKMIKPGSVGLTSRFTDKDTGEYDPKGGNMKLSDDQTKALERVQAGASRVRADDKKSVSKVSKKAPSGVTR
jgi:hypothetical protein